MNTTFAPSPLLHTQTIRRFGRAGVNYRSREPIPLDHLRRIAPAVFAEDKHASRSERYTYIPTAHLLERMAAEGFRPFAVMQGGSRDEEKRNFTKHLIRFRHESQSLAKVGDTSPEIVMINSHDGTSSYQLMAGMFRLVCSNGLVVSDGLVENVRVPHKGDIVGNVIDGCITILETLPQTTEAVREMQALQLTQGEQRIFTEAATIARYGSLEESPVRPDQLNTARRMADTGNDLWRTFNRTQESMMRGGVGYVHTNDKGERQHRRTREINGIDQSTNLNRALWHIAEQMRAAKATA